MLPSILSATLLFAGPALSSPLERLQSRATSIDPVINIDFPDPAVLNVAGTWYAFATSGNGKNVQSASAPAISGPWTVLPNDLLPTVGAWSNGANVWAPDVRQIGSTFVLYYTATDAASTNQHCVGTATSNTILGPYTPQADSIACNITAGGDIDPSGFTDIDGTHYVVYKKDGNSIGHGGSCGNTVAPIVPTPIMLRELAADGITPVGDPIQILDRSDADGPLIEAPNLILVNGVYILFFSSNCYTTTLYDISHATASSIKGPYTKQAWLAVTDNPFSLTAPGGATATVDGQNMVFHANCAAGRCMYQSKITVSGTDVSFST